MKIQGFHIKHFRSIGPSEVNLQPWKKCNILVGQNNCGKSNVIRAIQHLVESIKDPQKANFEEVDYFERDTKNVFGFRVVFLVEDRDNEYVKNISTNIGSREVFFEFTKINEEKLVHTDWSGTLITDPERAGKIIREVSGSGWEYDSSENMRKRKLASLSNSAFNMFKLAIPDVFIIPEFRQVRKGSTYQLDGQNLIGLLKRYQVPSIGDDKDREKFNKIQKFIRELLHLPESILEVTPDEELIINNQDFRLPLDSYGTGTHELVILLTAILSKHGDLICIEEPEIHMHPALQREFIEFLLKNTSNQYLISTHSHILINSMISSDDIQVFHLRNTSSNTIGQAVISENDSFHVLNDLGLKPSDILQANCIIWVEGPSDRLYIKRWLELVAPDLQEGKEFSIMFYGGRLLSHLSVNREKIPEEFIKLLAINQRVIVVIDSDRKGPGGRLNKTKERVIQECKENDGITWVTDGREIENLLPWSSVNRTIRAKYDKEIKAKWGKYEKFSDELDKALSQEGLEEIKYERSKVKYAREIIQYMEEGDLDEGLLSQLREIISAIKRWNG